jgi:pilus assembly protein CpaB
MNKTPLLIALTAAASAGVVGHLYLSRLEAELSGGRKVAVLMASEDVPLGSTLSEKSLVVRDVPEAYLDSRHVRANDMKKIVGARMSMPLRANESVLWSDVSSGASVRLLSTLVERGMRAVAIDGGKAADFDGLLRPGDRVDVLFTPDKGAEQSATVTLLQNLLVLSVGGSMAKTSDGPSKLTSRGSIVTLSASVGDAQILTHAREQGRLSLTIRNADDIALTTSGNGATDRDRDRRVAAGARP